MEVSHHNSLTIVLITCMITAVHAQPTAGDSTDTVRSYCRWETFNATCTGPDHMVLMTSALYGRMQLGRCINRNEHIGCSGDVLRHADVRCSGRRSCQISVPDEMLHEVQPCHKDLLTYLMAAYTCVPVVTGGGRRCGVFRPYVINIPDDPQQPAEESDFTTPDVPSVSSPSLLSAPPLGGYLSSVITDETGLGTSYCPWRLRAPPGKRLNLTLYDLNTLHYDSTSIRCQVYATVKQVGETRDIPVCGGSERIRHILLSDNNEVEIHVTTFGEQLDKPHFFIKYEAVGCPTLLPPSGGWSRRTGDTMTVGCNETTIRSHLVCRGTTWVGEIRNCTAIAKEDGGRWGINNVLGSNDSFPFGLFISITIGVILGILLGVLLLAIVLACRKRSRIPRENQYHSSLMPGGGKPLDFPDPADKYYPTGTAPRTGPGGPYTHIWEMGPHDTQVIHTVETLPLRKPGAVHNDGGAQAIDLCDGTPQLQQYHTDPKPTRPTTSMTGYLRGQGREHVYESPKIGRRDDEQCYTGQQQPHPSSEYTGAQVGYPGEPGEAVGVGLPSVHGGVPGMPYYHEFDPTDGSSKPSKWSSVDTTTNVGKS